MQVPCPPVNGTVVLARLLAVALAGATLAGCNGLTRLSAIGETPALTTIQDPQKQPGYRPVSMPMPAAMTAERRPNSLWQAGTRAFFKDQRAAQIGDILTVQVNLNEQANLQNETKKDRAGSDTESLPNIFGFEQQIPKILSKSASATNLLNTKGVSSSDGKGSIVRQEQVIVNVAASVTQVLPNGNLVVVGRQEMRVNYEVRELQVTGVIRTQDISATNTITLDKIAEARISYGGRGQITDIQQARYGQQLMDIILPW
jgi:flagellar L-ring protein precursor FlgH